MNNYNNDENKKLRYLIWLLFITFGGIYLTNNSKNLPFKEFFTAFGSVLGVGASIEIIKLFVINDGKGMLSKQLDSFVDVIVKLLNWKKNNLAFEKIGLSSIQFGWNAKAFFDQAESNDTLLWLDTFDPNYSSPEWKTSFRNALDKGVKIKMLVMDKDSEAAEMRAREVNAKWDFFDNQEHFNGYLFDEHNEDIKSGNLEVRSYVDLPCAPIYIWKKSNGEMRSYSSYFLTTRSADSEMPHFVFNQNEQSKGFSKMLMSYFDFKWQEAGESWESKFFPIGYWVYRFKDNASEQFIYGRYRIFRHRDGLHAEGEAWFEKDIQDESFIHNYRLKRRGLWRSREPFHRIKEKSENFYEIPYELVYEKSAGDLAGECYFGNFSFNYGKTLTKNQVLHGTLIRTKGHSDLKYGENPISAMRVSHSKDEVKKDYPIWLKDQFLTLKKKCDA